MRLVIRATLLLTLTGVLFACASHISNSGQLPIASPAPDTVRVATFNVHYIVLAKQEGRWSVADWHRRKNAVDDAFKAMQADIVAFQEMETFTRGSDGSVNLARDFLLAQNPDYAVAAVGDWRDFPSTQPIFYRQDRLNVVEQGWFFFSDTPDVIYSRTFNGSYPAYATWVRFASRENRRVFSVFNVHFDFASQSKPASLGSTRRRTNARCYCRWRIGISGR